MTQEEICKKALEKWGFENQKDKAIEEMSELTVAIIKERQYPDFNKTMDVISEIADVKIMIAQLELMYDSNEIQKQVEMKLTRLVEKYLNQ